MTHQAVREARPKRLTTRRPDRLLVPLMIGLTFATGMIDAIGFLGLHKVFTGNMTGNVVIIGMALAGADGIPLLGPTLALAGFALGAAVGGVVLRSAPPHWTGTTTAVFAVTGGVMVATGGLFLAGGSTEVGALALATTTVLGGAMGLQAAAARVLSVTDLTTVVITSTIVGLTADHFAADRCTRQWRRLAAVTAMLLGALCGSLLLLVSIGVALLCTGLIPAAVALLGHWMVRPRRPV